MSCVLPFSRLQAQVHQEPPDFSNHPLFETFSPRKLQKRDGLRNWRDSSLVPDGQAQCLVRQATGVKCTVSCVLPFSRLQTQVHQEPPDFSNHPLFETFSPRKLQKTGGLRNWRDSSLVPKPNAWSVRP